MFATKRHRRNVNEPGHAHALTFSCYKRFPLLSKEQSRIWLGDSIRRAHDKLQFDMWAFVVMPEHVHLVVWPRTAPYDIASIRSAIKEPVGRAAMRYLKEHSPAWLEKLSRRRGSRVERLFWQSGGGYDRNITTRQALLSTIDYIHLNPVRRGLVERPEDWQWSSAAWYLREARVPIPLDQIPPHWLDADDG